MESPPANIVELCLKVAFLSHLCRIERDFDERLFSFFLAKGAFLCYHLFVARGINTALSKDLWKALPSLTRGEFTLTGEESMEHVTSVFIADSAEDFCIGLSAALQRADGFDVG